MVSDGERGVDAAKKLGPNINIRQSFISLGMYMRVPKQTSQRIGMFLDNIKGGVKINKIEH